MSQFLKTYWINLVQVLLWLVLAISYASQGRMGFALAWLALALSSALQFYQKVQKDKSKR